MMNSKNVNNITPFVPAKDFTVSLGFYKKLGFQQVASIDNAVRLEIDGNGFWLQDYYVEDWAGNFMFCMYVQNLNEFWLKVKKLNIGSNYNENARIISEPHDQEGAKMMQLCDPSGVLWHIREGN